MLLGQALHGSLHGHERRLPSRGVDAYIATRKTDAEKLFASVPSTPALITHWSMHDKVASSRGKKIYALRKILVEPVFGQIKSAMYYPVGIMVVAVGVIGSG